MADTTFVKGFRTNMAYFPESAYGTFAVTDSDAYKVGGKVKSLNWTARHNIIKTASIGDGRNYKQQLYGTYDANGSINWEVSDLSFLRFAAGDIAKFGTGVSEANHFAIVDAELTGIDSDATSLAALDADDVTDFSKVRIRPFSILAYDRENNGTANYNESVDLIKGAMLTDANISGSIGTPLMATTNFVAQKIAFKRYLAPADVPDFTSDVAITTDTGNNSYALSPLKSYNKAQEAPLMFYEGEVSYTDAADATDNVLALVQSFSMGLNNNYRTYRAIGDKFIKMPTTGMRAFTTTLNLIFNLPDASSDGTPATSETSILEIIKNYLGHKGTDTFTTATELSPTTNSTPAETKTIKLKFTGTTLAGDAKGAEINLYNATPEGFGHPVQLENGLVEIPVTFSVIGYPYKMTGDGSYTGWDGAGTASTDLKPIFKFWTT